MGEGKFLRDERLPRNEAVNPAACKLLKIMVGATGLEPVTSCV
jgi:hypothetical protein